MIFPEEINVRDVTLRDGLQNENYHLSTENKLRWLDRIINAGFSCIEVTSFVHPKWVPALRDADELARQLPMLEGVEYEALIPNQKGLERFMNTGIGTAKFFLSASNAHNKANLNKTTDESLNAVGDLIQQARKDKRKIVGGIATAFTCPYSGNVPYSEVERIAERLIDSGVDELGLGDTIGTAAPKRVYEYCSKLADKFPDALISLHLHDTYGYGLTNVLAGMQAGVRLYDVAQAGLGGCPYAPGSPGNIKASQVLEFLERQDINFEIKLDDVKTFDREFPEVLYKKQNKVQS
ncbi:hydroxymethylglutaryl-CoA lyase [Alteribacillus bidgolensis]|uniref:Hydroxymethylglutaryl-CoA lyase n=1 Tax=Alteribacillus bidgolensis TaxID=930129 RepID=A0A1G8I8N8_9BACI|nr:hydroxymethylglutaryl-CoA lyase [Alteribacillus bidgolensis]SDI15212.1 hydroxymethylglutaryl-CoA lyase [Alteribacillus bidgolensis]